MQEGECSYGVHSVVATAKHPMSCLLCSQRRHGVVWEIGDVLHTWA